MKALYLIEAWGTCSEYDYGYNAWVEGKSLGYLEKVERGAKDARMIGKIMEQELRERAIGKKVKNIETFSQITRQRE
jgi:hypothetical protein